MNLKPKTTNELITVLRENGYNQSYETEDGGIAINCHSSLNCKVKKDANDNWELNISFNYVGRYFVAPLMILNLLSFFIYKSLPYGVRKSFSFHLVNLIALLIGFLLANAARKKLRKKLSLVIG